MLARITNHVGHGRLFPAIVNLLVAFGAGLRTGVPRRRRSGLLPRLLRPGKWAKTADKQHQFPAFAVGLVVRMAPSRHAREAHPILDDVVDLPVREILRLRRSQIWRLGIEIAPDFGHTGTVRTMANRASREEIIARLLQIFRRGFPRNDLFSRTCRNRIVRKTA
jgi:hypothetical protein